MAFGLFRKRLSEKAVTEVAPAADVTASGAGTAEVADTDSAKEILELLELELGGMIRQLERAASSVAGGAEATASTLSTIRQRTDALTERTSTAQSTATIFSQTASKFAQCAEGIESHVRDASRLADEASSAAHDASASMDRLRESSAAIGNVINLIAQIARQTTMLALNSTIEAARAGTAGRGFAVVATEVKALAVQTQNATEEIKTRIDALQKDAAGSVEAVNRISQAINAIRPVFESVNGAVGIQHQTTGEMTDNAANASHFIATVGDSAAEIDSAAKEVEAHGDTVAKAGRAVTMFAQKLQSRCAVLLRQGEREDRRKREPLPCNLKIEITTAQGTIEASVYEISLEGVLVGGENAGKLSRHERVEAVLEGIGACALRIGESANKGTFASFANPDSELSEKIEDRMWALHDENMEFVTRAMEAGTALTKIFESAVTSGAITLDDMFDEHYAEIANTNPLQYRTRILDWADGVLPPFQEAFLAKDPRMVFCAMIDRNGYLPVHNKLYSHPQRSGDVAWNTANSRNRRIFNDVAGMAAGRNQRSYLIQSYARDMGNGNTIMMREIDVPVRVQGRHWGGFRTAYKL